MKLSELNDLQKSHLAWRLLDVMTKVMGGEGHVSDIEISAAITRRCIEWHLDVFNWIEKGLAISKARYTK